MEKDTVPSMPCVAVDDSQRKPKANLIRITAEQGQAIPKNKGACGQVKQHMDHVTDKCYWGTFHNDMVHWPISIPDAVRIPGATAAVDTEWGTYKTLPARDVKKVTSKSEVLRQEKKYGQTIHFANLTDSCHVKNAELAKYFQKYKV